MSDTMVRTRRTISRQAATTHVHKNMVRYPRHEGQPEWKGYSLDTLEEFTQDVKSWLGDKSNLSTATLDAANYTELLAHFRELADWKPKKVVKTKEERIRTARAALADVHLEERPTRSRKKLVTATVAAPIPDVVTVAIPDQPKPNHIVPGNWRYMAEHANTASARAWWVENCNRRMRGEV